jgi:hypothetical protein
MLFNKLKKKFVSYFSFCLLSLSQVHTYRLILFELNSCPFKHTQTTTKHVLSISHSDV